MLLAADRYVDREFVAQGGMARVYRARRSDPSRVIALREIPGGPGSADRIHSESRGAEIQRALCEIDDRVPRVFDTFVSDAGWFYVEMEFVDGEDLAAVIERGPLPVAEAVRIAREVFDFLRIAHSTPVSVDGERREQQLHGDLAPKNIRLTREGAVKILDFGIAKGLQATATAVMFGSYGYISPERLRTGRMGTSDDFWSAGVVLYEMLAGRRAFNGSNEEIALALNERRPPLPLDDQIPRALRLIVSKLLAWDPAFRYPDATTVLADLDAFTSGEPTRAETETDDSRTRVVSAPDQSGARPMTLPAVPPLPIEIQPTTRISPTRRRPPSTGSRVTRKVIALGVLGIVIMIGAHEQTIGSEAHDTMRMALADPGNLDDLVKSYESLRDRAWFSSSTSELGEFLSERLTLDAATMLKDFRNDDPRLETQFRPAAIKLARAARINPDNKSARAWLRYAQGHLARLDGENARGPERRQALLRAVSLFEEASRLDSSLPDPYLGLARVYAYLLPDADLARRAVAAAEQRGHKPGRREHTELGDLSKSAAEDLVKQARQLRGTASEELLLMRARAEADTAIDEYRQAGDYANSSRYARDLERAVYVIDARLQSIRAPEIEAVDTAAAETLPQEQ
jgi:serine/threonine protein kinase